jgi:hypothetical protein
MGDAYYRTFHPNYVGIAGTAVLLAALVAFAVYALRRRAARR